MPQTTTHNTIPPAGTSPKPPARATHQTQTSPPGSLQTQKPTSQMRIWCSGTPLASRTVSPQSSSPESSYPKGPCPRAIPTNTHTLPPHDHCETTQQQSVHPEFLQSITRKSSLLTYLLVPTPEDYPVMPAEPITVLPRPRNFFDRNPALDVPPNSSRWPSRVRQGGNQGGGGGFVGGGCDGLEM